MLEMPSSDIPAGSSQVGYSLTLGLGTSRELCNYDTFAASFLSRTIYNGDYKFTLEVTPRVERCVSDIPVREVHHPHRYPSAASAVGQPVSAILWEILNINSYGWSCNPDNQSSLGYFAYPRSLPSPDEVDLFIAGCSFGALPDVNASYLWDHLSEVHARYEQKRSVIKTRQLGELAQAELIRKLEQHFERVSCELAGLAEKLGPIPGLRLEELLFPGSSAKLEVCTQCASDGNVTSFIGATETQTFSLDFVTS